LHNLHNLVVPHLKVLWKLKLRIGCSSWCWFLKDFSTSWKGLRRVGGGGGGGRGELIDHPQKKLKMHAQDRFFLQQEAWQSFFLLFEDDNNINVLIWSDLMGAAPPPPAMITHRQSNGFFFWTLISIRLNSTMCRFVWSNCPTSKSFQGIQLLNRHTNWNLGKTKKTDGRTDGRTEILQEQETELSYAANIWREEESHGTLFYYGRFSCWNWSRERLVMLLHCNPTIQENTCWREKKVQQNFSSCMLLLLLDFLFLFLVSCFLFVCAAAPIHWEPCSQ